MRNEYGKPRRQIVHAQDIVDELKQGPKGLNKRLLLLPTKSLLPLKNATIRGRFDLRNLVIDKPLEIQHCHFEDEVDLRYCEFKQVVNFADCTFHQGLNSGDEIESHTIYHKDLIFNGATFVGAMRLNGAQVEGSAYFLDARFLNEEHSADFTASSFGKALECNNAVFEGPVSFNMLHCSNNGYFNNAHFEGREEASFAFASFGRHIECVKAVFKGKAIFHKVSCGGSGHFENARFESRDGVDFAFASFGTNLYCSDVTFLGPVNFERLVCTDSGYFRCADFQTEAKIKFQDASFGRNLLCEGAKYGGEANFRSVKCGHSAVFKRATFVKEVDLRFLDLGRNLDLKWTYWTEGVKLGQIQVSKQLLLGGACFWGEVELYDSSIGTLELWDPNHPEDRPIEVRKRFQKNGEPDLISVVPSENELNDWCKKTDRSVSQELNEMLGSEKKEDLVYDLFPFRKGLKRNRDEAKRFVDKLLTKVKRQREPPPTRPGLNLTGTTFDRFHGGPSEELAQGLALKLADEQDPTKFSIDPYLQLRNHYLKIGDESKATELRLQGYRGLRENARKGPEGRTNWTWKRWMADQLLYRPTRYGYRIWPILLPAIVILFMLGTVVFWSQGTLEPVPGSKYELPHEAPLAQKLFDRSVYSLDLLIPALNLRYEAMWIPKSGWLPGWMYATAHSILGWILIALFITWLTGVIKPPD